MLHSLFSLLILLKSGIYLEEYNYSLMEENMNMNIAIRYTDYYKFIIQI